MISQGIIFLWPGTVATIPANWERVTALDGLHIKGTSGEASTTPTGSNSHTHTSPAHSHTIVHHTHNGVTRRWGEWETEGGGYGGARDQHEHSFTSSTTSGGTSSDAVSYASIDFQPVNYKYIFIRPSKAQVDFANGMVSLWGTSTVPSGFTFCDGSGGTTDLRTRFLKGASAGADAGVGADTGSHIHTVNHSHASAGHSHWGTTGWDSDSGGNSHKDGWSGGGSACDRHTHGFNLYTYYEGITSYTGSSPSKSTEPLHRKLVPIKNTSGGPRQVIGMIALWIGSLATIPRGWYLADGTKGTINMNGYYCKTVTTLAEANTIGGEATHYHEASNSHSHSPTATHRHTGGTDHFPQNGTTTANNNGISLGHSHEINDALGYGWCSYSTSSWNASTFYSDATANELYRVNINFIQYMFSKGGMIQAT